MLPSGPWFKNDRKIGKEKYDVDVEALDESCPANTLVNNSSLGLAALTCQEDNDFMRNLPEDLEDLRAQARKDRDGLEKQIEDAKNGKLKWEEDRKRGIRKTGKNIGRFAVAFQDFVKNFSGFIDIVRDGGGLYSEVAYSTLSLLFMFAIQKEKSDDKLCKHLDKIQKHFPRIKLAHEIYHEQDIEIKVAAVYRAGILFARKATEYFNKNSYRRWGNAMKDSVTNSIDQAAEDFEACLTEFVAHITIFQHQRIQQIQQELAVIHSLSDLNEEHWQESGEKGAREMLEKDREIVENISRLLNASKKYADQQGYRRVLARAFKEAFDPAETSPEWKMDCTQMDLKLLESNKYYQSWLESPQSCLLVFWGLTSSKGQDFTSGLCWLSPAAIHAANYLLSTTKRVVFCTCYPDIGCTKISVGHIFSSLIDQLLLLEPSVFRQQYRNYKAQIESAEWNASRPPDALKAHVRLLQETLGLLSREKPIWIIIDRLDNCAERTNPIIDCFQKILKESSNSKTADNVKVKIMMTMEPPFDHRDRSECLELLADKSACQTFQQIDWNQTQKWMY